MAITRSRLRSGGTGACCVSEAWRVSRAAAQHAAMRNAGGAPRRDTVSAARTCTRLRWRPARRRRRCAPTAASRAARGAAARAQPAEKVRPCAVLQRPASTHRARDGNLPDPAQPLRILAQPLLCAFVGHFPRCPGGRGARAVPPRLRRCAPPALLPAPPAPRCAQPLWLGGCRSAGCRLSGVHSRGVLLGANVGRGERGRRRGRQH